MVLLAVLCASNALAEDVVMPSINANYIIKNASTKKYVKVYRQYYAKPDVEQEQASAITVGIGAKVVPMGKDATETETAYRVYELTGDYDGGTAEVFEYFDKAIALAMSWGHDKVKEKLNSEVTIEWEFLEGDSYTFKAGDSFTFKKGDKFTFKKGDTYNGETLTEDKEVTFDEDYTYTFTEDYTYTFTSTRTISITVTLRELLDKVAEQTFDKELQDRHIDSVLTDFDQLIEAYADGYGYMQFEPLEVTGYNFSGFIKFTFPDIPEAANFAARAMTKDHVDAWTWAKRYVVAKLKERGSTTDVQNLVKNNIDKIEPGKTYYLMADDENTFDFSETPDSEKSFWMMTYISGKEDNLQSGDYYIQNKATEKVVRVYDDTKYKAEPELSWDDAQGNENALITLELGRYDRKQDNRYIVSKLENGEQDVVNYIHKGVWKARDIVVDKINNHKTKMQELLDSLNNTTKKALFKGEEDQFVTYTYDNLLADIDQAVELCERAYAYMYVIDNGDGTVGLSVVTPKMPWTLEKLYKWYKGTDNSIWDWAKEQIIDYFNKNPKGGLTGDFVKRNLADAKANTAYFLLAEDDDTFGYGEDATNDYAKWILKKEQLTLAEIEDNYREDFEYRHEVSVTLEDGLTYTLNVYSPGDKVTVADALQVVKKLTIQDGYDTYYYAIARDLGENSSIDTTFCGEDQQDYIVDLCKLIPKYQQNNWVLIQLASEDQYNGVEEGDCLAPGSLTGYYANNIAYTILTLDNLEKADTTVDAYATNWYVPANFNEGLLENGKQGKTESGDEYNIFLMNPKRMEFAHVTYAVWNDGTFCVVMKDTANGRSDNMYDLDGAFDVTWDYNEGYGDVSVMLVQDSVYEFDALILPWIETEDKAPRRATAKGGNASAAYTVAPIGFSGEDPLNPTGVTEVTTEQPIKSVRYYNIAGLESATPFPGLNIIVTTYNDGTRKAVKVRH